MLNCVHAQQESGGGEDIQSIDSLTDSRAGGDQ